MANAKKNDPAEWTRSWVRFDDPLDMYGSATYPRDGRETLFDPYEQFAPTTTVAEYGLAYERVRDGDVTLPSDFEGYLQQRVSNARRMLDFCDYDDEIDRFGNVVERQRGDGTPTFVDGGSYEQKAVNKQKARAQPRGGAFRWT